MVLDFGTCIVFQNGMVGDELDQNFLLQFLSPIFASQKSLASNLHDSYRSIVCGNGFLFSFMQVFAFIIQLSGLTEL